MCDIFDKALNCGETYNKMKEYTVITHMICMLCTCGMLLVYKISCSKYRKSISPEYTLTSYMVPESYCHKTHIAESSVYTEDEGLWDQEVGEGAVLKWALLGM